MENFYYSAIYSVLQDTTPQTTQAVALKKLRAKIIRLNSKHHLGMFIDNREQDRIKGEETSLHHLLKIRKRQAQLTVHQVYDTDGPLKTSPADIIASLYRLYETKVWPYTSKRRENEAHDELLIKDNIIGCEYSTGGIHNHGGNLSSGKTGQTG